MTDTAMSPRPGGVVVVGSISADLTSFSQRLPDPGETVLGDDFSLVLGGKGANQAVASALAGADTRIVGCVGDDLFQQLTLGSLQERGVDVSAVRVVAGPTGVAHIRVDASGENDIVVVPLANAHLGVDDVTDGIRAATGRASVLMTQLETPIAVTAHAIRSGWEAGMTVLLDPAPAARLADDLWTCVDVVTPNETEARLLTGITVDDLGSAEVAGRWFLERGVTYAVVTLASSGVVVVDAEGARHLPSPEVVAVDTTAAGDAFAGYLAAGLSEGAGLDVALPRAMAAGALAVTRRGASPSLPSAADVDAFLRQQADPSPRSARGSGPLSSG